MKVNAAGGFFHSYSASGSVGTKAGGPSPLMGRPTSDQVTLSKQVLAVVQLKNRLRAVEQARQDAENSPEAQMLESMRKAMEVQKACNKIAARVRAGDRVPLKDLRYLLKHDPQGYQMAMASRKPKEDPKKWKSAIPKEKQENGRPFGDAGGEPAGMQAASGCECSSGMQSGDGSSGGAESGASSGA